MSEIGGQAQQDWASKTHETWYALVAAQQRRRKVVDEDTWAKVRRGWEQGETAASLAGRFQVGLANLWRRRASEGWVREPPESRTPVPLEGWEAYARERREAFETQIRNEREMAEALTAFMAGGPLEDAPLWHLGFLMHWRARHLGEATAQADYADNRNAPWVEAVWDAEGALRPLADIDQRLLVLSRKAWRRLVGLPDGAAEWEP